MEHCRTIDNDLSMEFQSAVMGQDSRPTVKQEIALLHVYESGAAELRHANYLSACSARLVDPGASY